MVGSVIIFVVGCWLVGFYVTSKFVGYLTPNPFYANSQFYFKQFSSVAPSPTPRCSSY